MNLVTAHTLKAKGNLDHREDSDTLIAFDPTTSLDQAPHDRLAPPLKVGTGLASMPWAPAVASSAMIRRLTPLECERLQGFPDGWTCLCQPLSAYAADPDATALACRCPDSPRYRSMGNAVTVSVISWLGRRFPTPTPAAR